MILKKIRTSGNTIQIGAGYIIKWKELFIYDFSRKETSKN